jgi:NhaP-type Na+/H+ or K+/H+ antiporter
LSTELDFLSWLALTGALLLVMGLSSAFLRRLPISTAAIYLGIGLLLGPHGADWLRIDLYRSSASFERACELAMVISLFVCGLKLRLPFLAPAWNAALWLAGPVMLGCIAATAAFVHFALGLAPSVALFLGAALAPTDPVLASAISIKSAADRDRLRYALSGEAGLNDGAAFPFVGVALAWHEHGKLGRWALLGMTQQLVWAIPAGLAIGFGLGIGIGRLAVWLRSRYRDSDAPSDFLAFALVALSYVAAERLHALGFLAAFAAGVGLRRAELRVIARSPHPDAPRQAQRELHPPAEDLVPARAKPEHVQEPAIAAGVLVAETISFGDTAERLLEVALVAFLGVNLGSHWDWRALMIAAALFLVIRPFFTLALLRYSPTDTTQRWLIAWFGVRGIGSLYYLSYALGHGISGAIARELTDLTLSVVAVSIFLHGVSAQPLLGHYEKLRERLRSRRVRAARLGSEL